MSKISVSKGGNTENWYPISLKLRMSLYACQFAKFRPFHYFYILLPPKQISKCFVNSEFSTAKDESVLIENSYWSKIVEDDILTFHLVDHRLKVHMSIAVVVIAARTTVQYPAPAANSSPIRIEAAAPSRYKLCEDYSALWRQLSLGGQWFPSMIFTLYSAITVSEQELFSPTG